MRVVDANGSVRPDSGGLLLGGYEADPVQVDGERLGDGFQIEHLELDLAVLRRLADSVRERVRCSQEVFARGAIREHQGGLPTMSPDARFLLGESGALPGCTSPAAATWAGSPPRRPWARPWRSRSPPGGPPSGTWRPWPPDPFGPLDEEALRAATRLEYAYQYWGTKPEGSPKGVPKD